MRTFAPQPQATQQAVSEQPARAGRTAFGQALHEWGRSPLLSPATVRVQARLRVNAPGDRYEQEAEAVADRVMRMPAPDPAPRKIGGPVVLQPPAPDARIQRLSADRSPALEDAVVVEGEDEEPEAGQVQTLRSPGYAGGREAITPALLSSSQGSMSLDPHVRQFMEPRFRADFSQVQVHADTRAAALSHSIAARAFTYGRHIYFNAGEYQPASQEGRRVIAHELAHVIQQQRRATQLPGGRAAAAEQDAVASHGVTAPQMIQRLGPRGNAVRHFVAPWGSGPVGADYEVSTDGGSVVTAWSAYPVWKYDWMYWCHGHSLGTMYTYSYSVYSGTPMETVIRDEYKNVPPDQTQAGDLAVWTAGFDHSARFTKPVIQNGQLVPDQSELSTKNGQAPLAIKTLTQIAGTYGAAGIAVYRHK